MRTIFLILLITVAVNGSILDTLLNWKNTKQAETGETTVDKTIDLAADALKEAKNLAYAAVVESIPKLSEFSNSAWESMYDAYSAAWLKYQEAKLKVSEWSSAALDKGVKLYTTTRDAVNAASAKLTDYVNSYKDKAEDRMKETYFEGLDNLNTELQAASEKYDAAKNSLINLYNDAYTTSMDDYQVAAQFYSDSTDRLKKWTDSKTKGQNYEATKAKLEDGRLKAKTYYKESLQRSKDLKAKIDSFNKEVLDSSQKNYVNLKLKVDRAAADLKSYLGDAKAKTGSSYETIKLKLQGLQTKASDSLTKAELDLKIAKDLIEKYSVDTLLSIREKFQNLKDEL